MPHRRRKKRLTGIGVAVGAMSPIRPNVIWAMDFQFDTTADGRTLKMLNVIDEFTREALAIEVDRAINADGVVDVLDRLALRHGAPHYVRFDNGPSSWPTPWPIGADSTVPVHFSSIPAHRGRTPGSNPSTAACVTNCSTPGASESLREARVIIEDWRCDYNANRPHSAHGELTPAEFALQWTTTHQPPSRITTGPPNGSPHCSFRAEHSRRLSDRRVDLSETSLQIGETAVDRIFQSDVPVRKAKRFDRVRFIGYSSKTRLNHGDNHLGFVDTVRVHKGANSCGISDASLLYFAFSVAIV